MTAHDILQQLEALGTEQTRKTFRNHGAPDPLFGVKVGDMKTITKKVKKNHALSLEVYASGNPDAQYFAALIADERQITSAQLHEWAQTASWHMVSEYAVAAVAAESPHGWALGLQWIESPEEKIAAAGWSTLGYWVMLRPDAELDKEALRQLLQRVEHTLHQSANRVRYTMNGFIIALGSAVPVLTPLAVETAQKLGTVSVFMGKTACKVPEATAYIEKVHAAGKAGAKRKMARC